MPCPCLGCGKGNWEMVIFLSVLKRIVSQHFLKTVCLEWRGSKCNHNSWWCFFLTNPGVKFPGFGTARVFKNGKNVCLSCKGETGRIVTVAVLMHLICFHLEVFYLTAGKAAGPNVELPMKGSKRITEKPV